MVIQKSNFHSRDNQKGVIIKFPVTDKNDNDSTSLGTPDDEEQYRIMNEIYDILHGDLDDE